jgi:di/tricarboxylate transporter
LLSDEIILFILIGGVLGLLIWGRWRYDIVAFGALMAAVLLGVIPSDKAFEGFGHPATIIIALVLIVSRGLTNAGFVDQLARLLATNSTSVPRHVGLMSVIAALLSAVMNNVAALALLMPLDMQAAAKAKRPPGVTLMALSFATLLGGLVTLIGTPPNIVVASFRARATGEPFGMFDFTPVGGAVAVAGLIFLALIGWRLIPPTTRKSTLGTGFELKDYIAEARVKPGARIVGERVVTVRGKFIEHGSDLLAVIRDGVRQSVSNRLLMIEADDILVIEAAAQNLDKLVGEFGLDYVGKELIDEKALQDLTLIELVVPQGARLEGRSVQSSALTYRYQVSLVGISRQGRRITNALSRTRILPGDVLLMLVPEADIAEIVELTGCLPLAPRGLSVTRHSRAAIAASLFAGAIVAASTGLITLTAALALVVVFFVALGLVGQREIYTAIEWPVIVLLGSMIPLAAALETSGGTAHVAEGLLAITSGAPAWVALTLLLIITMTLSDVLNNVATAVIAAPVGFEMARNLGVNPDAFLMAVAVGASCSFLTPVGHKNNILVLGPGGYSFGDYWRLGLPLETIIVVVAVPMLLVFWPL